MFEVLIKVMRSKLLFFRFLVGVNINSSLLLKKLFLYLLAVSYLVYHLLNYIDSRTVYSVYLLVILLISIPFFQVTIWDPIRLYQDFIKQLYSNIEIWLGITLFSSAIALFVGAMLYGVLLFFGFPLLLSFPVMVLLVSTLLSINSVIQFGNTVFLGIKYSSSSWLYLLVIPICIPIFATSSSSWNLKIGNTPLSSNGLLQQDYWLFGLMLLFSASSYLLFDRIWKS